MSDRELHPLGQPITPGISTEISADAGLSPSAAPPEMISRTADALKNPNLSPEALLSIYAENLLMGTGVQVIFGEEILRRLRAASREGGGSPDPDLQKAVHKASTELYPHFQYSPSTMKVSKEARAALERYVQARIAASRERAAALPPDHAEDLAYTADLLDTYAHAMPRGDHVHALAIRLRQASTALRPAAHQREDQ
jgi:hypothetical protein